MYELYLFLCVSLYIHVRSLSNANRATALLFETACLSSLPSSAFPECTERILSQRAVR